MFKIGIITIILAIVWISIVVLYLNKKLLMRDLAISIEENTVYSGSDAIIEPGGEEKVLQKQKLLSIERKILTKLKVKPNNLMFYAWIMRIVVGILLAIVLFRFKGLAFGAIGAVIVSFIFNEMHKDVVFKSGINDIPRTMNFLNSFIPNLNAGNSPAQAMSIYIANNEDEELQEYINRREEKDYKISPAIKNIVSAYIMAEESESQGLGGYVQTLNDMAEDFNAKSSYHNKFLGAMGEIKPISYAYYFGIPIVIFESYSQTQSFWDGIYSWPMALGLLALFSLFKFFIYKLEAATIKKIF